MGGSHLYFNDAMSEASSGELEVTFSQPNSKRHKTETTTTSTSTTFRDPENFMSYHPSSINMTDDRAYGVHSGSNTNFTEAARSATMDLAMDESSKTFGEARSIMRWDKRHKKYVRRDNDDDGSKNSGKRLVRGESGAKIAASFRSGRFDRWKQENRIKRVARTGEAEGKTSLGTSSMPAPGGVAPGAGGFGKRFRHKTLKMPKAPDKFREDYEKQKKKATGAKERTENMAMSGNKKELRSVDHMVKERRAKEKRREKNARPSRKR